MLEKSPLGKEKRVMLRRALINIPPVPRNIEGRENNETSFFIYKRWFKNM
jgi:hypothetical protein